MCPRPREKGTRVLLGQGEGPARAGPRTGHSTGRGERREVVERRWGGAQARPARGAAPRPGAAEWPLEDRGLVSGPALHVPSGLGGGAAARAGVPAHKQEQANIPVQDTADRQTPAVPGQPALNRLLRLKRTETTRKVGAVWATAATRDPHAQPASGKALPPSPRQRVCGATGTGGEPQRQEAKGCFQDDAVATAHLGGQHGVLRLVALQY